MSKTLCLCRFDATKYDFDFFLKYFIKEQIYEKDRAKLVYSKNQTTIVIKFSD